jgi:hypothetical protein
LEGCKIVDHGLQGRVGNAVIIKPRLIHSAAGALKQSPLSADLLFVPLSTVNFSRKTRTKAAATAKTSAVDTSGGEGLDSFILDKFVSLSPLFLVRPSLLRHLTSSPRAS